jgi:hypothetical protein
MVGLDMCDPLEGRGRIHAQRIAHHCYSAAVSGHRDRLGDLHRLESVKESTGARLA